MLDNSWKKSCYISTLLLIQVMAYSNKSAIWTNLPTIFKCQNVLNFVSNI